MNMLSNEELIIAQEIISHIAILSMYIKYFFMFVVVCVVLSLVYKITTRGFHNKINFK